MASLASSITSSGAEHTLKATEPDQTTLKASTPTTWDQTAPDKAVTAMEQKEAPPHIQHSLETLQNKPHC